MKKDGNTKNSSVKKISTKKCLKVNPDGTVTYRMKAGKDTVVASMPYNKAVKLEKDDRFLFEYADGDSADVIADNSADNLTDSSTGSAADNIADSITENTEEKEGTISEQRNH